MKREGDITIPEAIEELLKKHSNCRLLRDGGKAHEYDGLGVCGDSEKFSRKYRLYCSRYDVLRGHIDILLEFDYRIGRGRLVIRDDVASPLCGLIPNIGDYLYKLQRYFSNNDSRGGHR